MPSMDLDTEHSASRTFERGMALANFAQAGVLLLAFGALTTAVLWPEFGRGAIVIAAVKSAFDQPRSCSHRSRSAGNT